MCVNLMFFIAHFHDSNITGEKKSTDHIDTLYNLLKCQFLFITTMLFYDFLQRDIYLFSIHVHCEQNISFCFLFDQSMHLYLMSIFSHFCLKNRLCSYNLIFEFLELVKTTYKSVFRYYCDTVQLVNHYDKHWLYCKMKLSLILQFYV